MGFYGPHVLLKDGQRHGVEVLPPDINQSGADCSIEPTSPIGSPELPALPGVGEEFISTGPDGAHPRDTLVFSTPKRAEMQSR